MKGTSLAAELWLSNASMCIEGGVDPKILQALLGHSFIRMTMNIYSHFCQAAFDLASRALEAVASGGAKVIRMPRREEKGGPR
jgi:integrase